MEEHQTTDWKYTSLNAGAVLATSLGFWSIADKSRLLFQALRPADYLDFLLSLFLVMLALGIAKAVSDFGRGTTAVKVFWSTILFTITAVAVSWISYQLLLEQSLYQSSFLRLTLPLALLIFPVWAYSYHLRRHLDRIEDFHRRRLSS